MKLKDACSLEEKLRSTFSSVHFSCSVMSDSLRPQELQHARPPCPSPTPRVYPNSCPLSRRCHPAISSSVVPFSFLPSIFPSSRVFCNESVLRIRCPKYSFRIDWLELLVVQGILKSFLQCHSSKAPILQRSTFFMVQLSHLYKTTGKP